MAVSTMETETWQRACVCEQPKKSKILIKGIKSVSYKIITVSLELGKSDSLYKENGDIIELNLGFVKLLLH